MRNSSKSSEVDTSRAIMRKRIFLLFAVVCLGLFLVVAKLSWVQIINNPFYKEKALNQRMRPVPVDATRGKIVDRNGKELAVSVSADSIYCIPREIVDPTQTAQALAPVLNMSVESIYNKLVSVQQTVWIKRKVDPQIATAVRALDLVGIALAESSERFYPKDTLAAHILGFAGIDNQGLEGTELEYDSILKGARGQIVAERDATGKEIPEGLHSYVEPVQGATVVLSIDEVFQYIAEREIKKAVDETNSTRGLVLAMDVKTGEVLVDAIYPSYNPNSFSEFTSQMRRNFAIIDAYEPGSTFKIVTTAAALEEGLVSKNDTFYDPGFVKIGGSILRCWKAGGHGHQTFAEALGNSCNPVFVDLALKLGAEKFSKYIKLFGFGVKTGVDFPGEAAGSVPDYSKLGPVELATTGFGQGISVTPLQMLSAVCAVANKGVLMKPIMVKEVIDADGNTVQSNQPTKVRQVISEKTAKDLVDLLVEVVSVGSGNKAAVLGFPVAGKTGTAQKAENGIYGAGRIASFIGFAPADDPQIAMLIILDEPKTEVKFGGVLAAPVFGAIMSEMIRHLELIPSYPTNKKNVTYITVPDVVDKSPEVAKQELTSLGFAVRTEGSGSFVMNQVPMAGASVEKGKTIVLTLTAEDTRILMGEDIVVPKVVGKTLKDALLVLGAKNLSVIPKGSGFVKTQSPAAGTTVNQGDIVEIYLEE